MNSYDTKPRAARLAMLAAMLLVAGAAAHAQSSVTLYGILDAGVQYLTNADGQHGAVRLQNYGVLPSQIGVTGTEDLGGGLQAIFKLEQGFNLNDGTPTVPGIAFFRGAYVGLAGNFGTATIGRQFSVLFDKTVFFDPLFYASYSGQAVLIPVASNFIDNAVKYKSREFGGFNFEALAATGGVAGNSRSGRVLEIGGEYSGTPVGVSAVLHQSYGTVSATADTSGQHQIVGTLAAHWNINSLTLYGGAERQTGSRYRLCRRRVPDVLEHSERGQSDALRRERYLQPLQANSRLRKFRVLAQYGAQLADRLRIRLYRAQWCVAVRCDGRRLSHVLSFFLP